MHPEHLRIDTLWSQKKKKHKTWWVCSVCRLFLYEIEGRGTKANVESNVLEGRQSKQYVNSINQKAENGFLGAESYKANST